MSFKPVLRTRWLKSNRGKQPGLAAQDIILGLLQWEKSFGLIEKSNKYVFLVPIMVNKIDIARWFTELYGKTPTDVNTVILPSKHGSRRLKRRSYKKAIITLAEGEKIEIV